MMLHDFHDDGIYGDVLSVGEMSSWGQEEDENEAADDFLFGAPQSPGLPSLHMNLVDDDHHLEDFMNVEPFDDRAPISLPPIFSNVLIAGGSSTEDAPFTPPKRKRVCFNTAGRDLATVSPDHSASESTFNPDKFTSNTLPTLRVEKKYHATLANLANYMRASDLSRQELTRQRRLNGQRSEPFQGHGPRNVRLRMWKFIHAETPPIQHLQSSHSSQYRS